MAENTKIEWTDHTFNSWEGCQKVGPGCDNCYAETRNARFAGGTAINWGPGAPRRRTSAANWALPKRWNAQAAAFMAQHGRRQRVFCASLADVFDNAVDPQWRADLFALIASTPNLDWLLLTKRIGNAKTMMADALHVNPAANRDGMIWPLPNVWLGATITDQPEADRDIPKLLTTPAAVHFLSMEPLLREVHIRTHWLVHHHPGDAAIDWVIVGGESGPGARPMHPDWARSLRDQCAVADVPFLFKQWGEWGEPDSIERTNLALQGWFEQDRLDGGVPLHEWQGPMQNGVELASLRPEVFRVGKKAAGRLLDGRTHDWYPALIRQASTSRAADSRTWDGTPQ